MARVRRPLRDPGAVPADPTDPPSVRSFACPRCADAVEERFYGPCRSCRAQLRATQGGDGRIVDAAAYEPKVNVTPNAVATKE